MLYPAFQGDVSRKLESRRCGYPNGGGSATGGSLHFGHFKELAQSSSWSTTSLFYTGDDGLLADSGDVSAVAAPASTAPVSVRFVEGVTTVSLSSDG